MLSGRGFGLGMAASLWVMAALFPAGCSDRHDPTPETAVSSTADLEGGDRDRIRRFWGDYRAANAARLAGRLDEAETGYREALEFQPEHEDALYYLGNVLLEKGDVEGARSIWMQLLRVNPASARAHGQLGQLALCRPEAGLGDLESAIRSFRSAHALNREETGSPLRLALAFLLRGEADSAAAYLDDVLGSHGQNAAAIYLRSYVDWSQGHSEAARRRYAEGMASIRHSDAPVVAGEGDTRLGMTPIGQSDVGCPSLEGIVPELLPEAGRLDPAFRLTGRRLEEIRSGWGRR